MKYALTANSVVKTVATFELPTQFGLQFMMLVCIYQRFYRLLSAKKVAESVGLSDDH